MGIVGSGGVLVIDQAVVSAQGFAVATLAKSAQEAAQALADFERDLRDGGEPPDLRASTVILVDDGRTPIDLLRMAIVALRQCWVKGTVLAIPTITAASLAVVRTEAEAIVSTVVTGYDVMQRGSTFSDPSSISEIRQLLRGVGTPSTVRPSRQSERSRVSVPA